MTQVLPRTWTRVQTARPGATTARQWDWNVFASGLSPEMAHIVYGDSEDQYAGCAQYELALEQHRRRHVFVKKLRSRRRFGGLPLPEAVRSSRLITADQFASLYAAAEFAAEFWMPLDTMVTIAWSLLGFREANEVQGAFTAFMKCASEWLRHRGCPVAFIYAHECGPELGLHTHVAIHIPAPFRGPTAPPRTRQAFRRWVRDYPMRNLGRRAPRALRVTYPRCESLSRHWHRFSYLVKGAAISETVLGAQNAPDRGDVKLGDLIAFPWCDPGPVTLRMRVGSSQSLGDNQRKIGVPTGFEHMLPRTALPFDFAIESRESKLRRPLRPSHLACGPFRSKFEDGIRDVRKLYPREFWEPIIGPEPNCVPVVTSSVDEDDCLGTLEY